MRYNISILFICLLLTACSQKTQDVGASLNEAVFGFPDSDKSPLEILSLPYASCHVRIDRGAQLFMVLAFAESSPITAEQNQLKWLSSDRAMLTTQNGRLVKTLRLPSDNLANILNTRGLDPLLFKGEKPAHQRWAATYDWQPNYRFNYTANITWDFIKNETINSAVWEKKTGYYQERVSIPSLDIQFTNHFWLDKQSHQVVKSIQHLGPEMQVIEMTILKPFSG